MDELVDSAGLAGDLDELHRRMRRDGYIFFRGALDRDTVVAAADAVRRRLSRAGWFDRTLRPTGAVRATDQGQAWKDRGYRGASMSAAFNAVPYLPPLANLVAAVSDATVFCYPVKVLRVVYPESLAVRQGGRFVHQDYAVIGRQDMFTSWIPFVDVPVELGGLAVAPGSPSTGPRPPGLFDPSQAGWATTDYQVGDVLVFHALTSHAALPNRTDRMRISGEYRWQSSVDPVPPGMVFGPNGRRDVELWSRLFRFRRWWRPVPAGLRYEPPGGPDPPPSRFVDAVPGPWPRLGPGGAAPH